MEKPEAVELSTPLNRPTFRQAVWVWIKIGLLSFGGPAGQIALMHRELVEKHRWVSNGRFLHALNYCMLLPGPEAQQLAIYVGWLLHRTWGGIVAGALFVLPGAILMWGISVVYVLFGKVPAVDAVFYGLKPAVMAIVVAAVLRIGKKALRSRLLWAVAGVSFGLIFLNFPFPLIVLGAALVGGIGMRWFPDAFSQAPGHGHARDESSVIGDGVSVNLAAPTAVGTIQKIVFWG
ncbi:MAG: chromate transporter, partial [Chthoniobacterales bacterium]